MLPNGTKAWGIFRKTSCPLANCGAEAEAQIYLADCLRASAKKRQENYECILSLNV
jgi:hypothetical protein